MKNDTTDQARTFDLFTDLLSDSSDGGLCHKCLTIKEFDQFRVRKNMKSGRRNVCKQCEIKFTRENEKANPERVKKTRAKWYRTNPEKHKNWAIKYKYGITLEVLNSLIENQGGKCKICIRPLVKGKLTHIDHCHNTGKVRGILCNTCNGKLGWLENNFDRISKYLEK